MKIAKSKQQKKQLKKIEKEKNMKKQHKIKETKC